jgi:hypothetical protein
VTHRRATTLSACRLDAADSVPEDEGWHRFHRVVDRSIS